jgi:hypothetical protein
MADIESRIRFERVVTPQGWQDEFSVFEGATFNLAHNLTQMLYFRPHNRFGRNVYLVGGGTHPGSGLPVIFEGARITTRLLLEDRARPACGPQRTEACRESRRRSRVVGGDALRRIGSIGCLLLAARIVVREPVTSIVVPIR